MQLDSMGFPYAHKDIKKIERVQNCTARVVTSEYSWDESVTGLINDLEW